jgi:hypothetical protein
MMVKNYGSAIEDPNRNFTLSDFLEGRNGQAEGLEGRTINSGTASQVGMSLLL